MNTVTAEERQAAHEYVTNNPDSEIRRMYGHHLRSFLAGVEYATSREAKLIQELKNSHEVILGLYTLFNNKMNESQLRELRSAMTAIQDLLPSPPVTK